MISEDFKYLFYKLCQIRSCVGLKDYKMQMTAINKVLTDLDIKTTLSFKDTNDWTLALQIPGKTNNNICPIKEISDLKKEFKNGKITMRLYNYDTDWEEYYILHKKSETKISDEWGDKQKKEKYILTASKDKYELSENNDGFQASKYANTEIYSFSVKDFFDFQIPEVKNNE